MVTKQLSLVNKQITESTHILNTDSLWYSLIFFDILWYCLMFFNSCWYSSIIIYIHFTNWSKARTCLNWYFIIHNFHLLYIKFVDLSNYGHLSPKLAKHQNYLYQNYLNQSPGQVLFWGDPSCSWIWINLTLERILT